MSALLNIRFKGSWSMLLFVAFILSLPVHGQVRVTRVTAPDNLSGKNGVVYSLPRTVLTLELLMTRTDEIPGPYASFSEELLGLEPVIGEKRTVYSLESATLLAYVEPDPDQVYFVELDEKASEAVLLEFSRNGLLAGAEYLDKEEVTAMEWITEYDNPSINASDLFPLYKEASLKEVVDTITRVVTFDTVIYQEKVIKRSMIEQTEYEKASEAVARMNDIEQDQYTLLVGYQETAYEYEAIRYMYDQLEKRRRDYQVLFTGVTRKEQFRAKFFVTPSPEMVRSGYAVASFSSITGLGDPDTDESVEIRIQPNGMTSVIGDAVAPDITPAGYYYRIPETCEVSVVYQDKVLARETLLINQAGVVRYLPAEVTKVRLDPQTGGILQALLK